MLKLPLILKRTLNPPYVVGTSLVLKQGVAGVGVPTGGTTGQVLVKKSGANHDTEWQTISGGGSDLEAGTGIGIADEVISVDTSVISTKVYAETVANAALLSANAATALVENLAEVNAFKIGQLEDGFDTLDQTVADNFTSLSTSKADQSAFEALQDLVDTKATPADISAAIADLVGAAPESLNTLYEIAAALEGEQATIDAILSALGNCVRFDAAQTLTAPQQSQARTNIGAEQSGVAAGLVAAITPESIGAATTAQGTNADTAIQSSDLAPVGLSGSFSDLINKSALFNLVYSAYVIGSNTAILASDTLGEMLGKLQAQINNKEPSITSGSTGEYWSWDKTWRSFATDVLNTVLTGFSASTATPVTAADSNLIAIGKLQGQINTLAPTTFNQSRWQSEDFLFDAGKFTFTQPTSGLASCLDNPNLLTSGCARLFIDGFSGSGGFAKVESEFAILRKAGLLIRSIFVLDNTAFTHRTIGLSNVVSGTTSPTAGIFLRCASAMTNSYSVVAVNGGSATTVGTTTLPANTILFMDMEWLTLTSVRVVVFDATNKYIDQTITTNLPVSAQKFCASIYHINTSSPLLYLDYVGWGHTRPPETITPA